MIVRICASVVAKTMQELERMVNKANRDGADFIEIRLDYLRSKYTLKEIRKLSSLPLIATNRSIVEGGSFEGSEDECFHILYSAAESGFEFIDLELSTDSLENKMKSLVDLGVETIVSSHFFTSPPFLRLNSIFKRELNTGASICKIVAPAKSFEDNLIFLDFVKHASKTSKVVCFGMGELGVTSRLFSPLVGGYLTYASVEKGKEAALGQLTVSEMRRFYELMEV